MVSSYYSNGKLLLSGEYLVLHGANALVLPLKMGQHMKITATGPEKKPAIRWQANVLNEPWFHAEIDTTYWSIRSTDNAVIASRLSVLLQEAGKMNHLLFSTGTGFDILTETGFDINWGFGSSATLTANLAQWAMIDPFELHFRTSTGSGADIAAAISPGSVLYRVNGDKPQYHRVDFRPSFLNYLWLVYLGKKQDTRVSIEKLDFRNKITRNRITHADKLTHGMIQARTLDTFIRLMGEHEALISEILGIPGVRKLKFPDFPGEIKSLGAWGGDFVLVACKYDEKDVREYFDRKGLNTVLSFDKIIL